MSEKLERGARDLSRFDAMTTQELEEILWLDSEAPMGQGSDTETILHIMEVLTKRNQTNDSEATAQRSWESFQQYYLPEIEERLDDDLEETKPVKPLHRRPRRWLVAAAVIALLVCIPLAVGARNWDKTQDILATWKDGIFSFTGTDHTQATEPEVTESEATVDFPYTSLQEALEGSDISPDIVPTWVPEGYVLVDIVIDDQTHKQHISALYLRGDEALKVMISTYVPSSPSQYFVNDELYEFYQSAGTGYYIFYNVDRPVAIWLNDSYECFIGGDLTIEELKMMIDSIGKG